MRPLVRFQSSRPCVFPPLSQKSEYLADNRVMEVQVLQGGLLVVEAEAVEARGRDPRPSGCKSHRSPQGNVDSKDTEAACKVVAIWPTGCKSQRSHQTAVD